MSQPLAPSRREIFARIAEQEMAKFEEQERELRKREREERALSLHLPVSEQLH